MESALNDTLKNLCNKYGWFYGVFWSYDDENPLLLTLKKVYCVDEDMFLTDDMFPKVYVVGDELVGQVAFSGVHSWVSSDTLLEELVPFQLGHIFQTVAVVPLEPRGVAQFGSFTKITESVEFLNEAKRLFNEIETVDECISIDKEEGLELDIDLLELDQLLSPTWSHQPPLVDPCPQSSQLRSTETLTQNNAVQNIDTEPQESVSFDSLGSDDFDILASLLEDPEEISLENILENPWSFTETATDTDHLPGHETSADNFQGSNGLLLDQELGHVPLNGLGSNILPSFADCNHSLPSHCQDISRFDQVLTSGHRVSDLMPAQESLLGIKRNMPDYSSLLLNGISSKRLKYNSDWTALGRSSLIPSTTTNFSLKYKQMDGSKGGVTTSVAKVVKMKAKPGEARHRPKDRELQHKFYAQLRSLVPDGQKCTQDGLLKRTISHISFLQSVSKHADMLNHGYNLKLNGEGSANDCLPFESGESLDNPITVEVLSPAGYYAIKMKWDGRMPIFETLDMLRGHGLNILNGTMDAQNNDKTWAYFIVETVGNSSKEDIRQLITQLLYTNNAQHNQLDSFQGQSEFQPTSVNGHFPHNVIYDRF